MTPYSSGSAANHHGQCITPKNRSATKIMPSQPIHPPSVNPTNAKMNLMGRSMRNLSSFMARYSSNEKEISNGRVVAFDLASKPSGASPHVNLVRPARREKADGDQNDCSEHH